MRLLPVILCLAACADLPPIEGSVSPEAQASASPVLVPVDTLLAEARIPSRAEAAQRTLDGRGARLRGVSIPGPGAGGLDARGKRLRDRADALRDMPL